MRAILFDATKCIGCGSCEEACRTKNGLPEQQATDLNATRFTVLKKVSRGQDETYSRRLCMHCLDPACASVCPVGALRKTRQGPVVYDSSACLGCRYCILACPFDVPRYEWSSLAPRVRKCSFCADRLAQGQPNACAEACPVGATIAGEREELLREARARIAAEPDKYFPEVYGEKDAGGTSVLYISPVSFEQLGLPSNLPKHPLPATTYAALSKIPAVVSGGGLVLASLWWLTRRKHEVARAESRGGTHPAGVKGVRS